jgi:hypothetical protein
MIGPGPAGLQNMLYAIMFLTVVGGLKGYLATGVREVEPIMKEPQTQRRRYVHLMMAQTFITPLLIYTMIKYGPAETFACGLYWFHHLPIIGWLVFAALIIAALSPLTGLLLTWQIYRKPALVAYKVRKDLYVLTNDARRSRNPQPVQMVKQWGSDGFLQRTYVR